MSDDIASSYEYQAEFIVPTRGVIYADDLPNGAVFLEAMGTREEKVIAAKTGNIEALTTTLIRNCCQSGVPPEEMATIDRFAILMRLRLMTFGGRYRFQMKCEDCGDANWVRFDLSDLEFNVAPDSFEEPFPCYLPLLKKNLGLRLLRGTDEVAIAKYGQRRKKKGLDIDGDPTYTYRMALHVMEIDGNDDMPLNERLTLVESLKGPDSLAIRDALDSIQIGYNLEIEMECPSCGYINDVDVPFNREFFRPSRHTANRQPDSGPPEISG